MSFNAYWHVVTMDAFFGSLKVLQTRLTVRANINIFLGNSVRLNFVRTGQDST